MDIGYKELLTFYKGKKVFITGNTGFKGSWLTYLLLSAGAKVTGYAWRPPTEPNLYTIAGLGKHPLLHQHYADVRDLVCLRKAFITAAPEIVFHLAAQPIVRDSFCNPVDTYSTNVMGTVNVCECIRTTLDITGGPVVKSFLNVTTDKVYRNKEWYYGYREDDFLDGTDPYSNSKSCSELVTHSYKDSFFQPAMDGEGGRPAVKVSTARAGNVIGGGDFSNDRIIPDCVRAVLTATMQRGKSGNQVGTVIVRNPGSTRPYEHVLEPLFVYLLIAKAQYGDSKYASYYNVGPDDVDCIRTGDLVDLFCSCWNKGVKDHGYVKIQRLDKAEEGAPKEVGFLKLDCSKLKYTFQWQPRWHIGQAVNATVDWTKVWMGGGDIIAEMNREIEEFIR